jgi:hypothetical protein
MYLEPVTFSIVKNVVSSDEGFSVELLMPPAIRYTEADRSLVIHSEFLMGDVGLAIYLSTVRHWDPPGDEEAIGNAAKVQIGENIRRAFEFTGRAVDIN